MSTPLGDLELGSPESSGSEAAYVAQLGRISGKLLQANLVRNGIDLSVRNEALDDDLLYLDVNNLRVGVNNDNPTVTLDVTGKAFISESLTSVGTQATFGNVTFNSDGSVTSTTGPINIYTTGPSAQIEIGEARTPSFKIKDNYIESLGVNENIQLSANASGFVDILSSVRIDGDLDIDGRIAAYSDVRLDGQLIVGDSPVDVIVINPDFQQSIIPGANNTYTLGSADKRWGDTWIEGTLISSVANIDQILISEQMRISGNTIDTIRSNDDLTITYKPGQGIVLENLRIDRTTPTGGPHVLQYTIDNPNGFGTPASDRFGFSCAASDSYFIVGADGESDALGSASGKAYIFRAATGELLHTLDNPNPVGTSVNDRFGWSVGISESYAIVGAYLEESTTTSDNGKAYIFSTTTGALLHTLDDPNPEDFARFAYSVSISESYAIVGAYNQVGGSGRAYIFDTATGALIHTLNNPNVNITASNDGFGLSVAITETHAIIGAPFEDQGGTNSGAAYIFSPSTATLLHTLIDPNIYGTPANDNFGYTVALSENYAAVGAYRERFFSGAAYIIDLATGTVLHSIANPGPNASSGTNWFGEALAITDSYTIIGAEVDNSLGAISIGRVYIYDTPTGTLLHTIENPNAFGGLSGDRFGACVALTDTFMIAGAHGEDETGNSDSGKVYFFDNGISTDTITNLSTTEPLTFTSTGTGYLKIADTNAMRIPFGTTAERPSAEVGETRWNSDLGYVECFDGSVYLISTGGGTLITPQVMEELGHVYTLILG